MDEPYTKRENDMIFAEIKETLARIEDQTVRTNGRVSNLERWKSYLAGAFAVILFLFPIFSWIYYGQIKELRDQMVAKQ